MTICAGRLCNLEVAARFCIFMSTQNVYIPLLLSFSEFLPRDAIRKDGICCRLYVCLSVSHGGALYPHGCRYRRTFFHSGSPFMLVF